MLGNSNASIRDHGIWVNVIVFVVSSKITELFIRAGIHASGYSRLLDAIADDVVLLARGF